MTAVIMIQAIIKALLNLYEKIRQKDCEREEKMLIIMERGDGL